MKGLGGFGAAIAVIAGLSGMAQAQVGNSVAECHQIAGSPSAEVPVSRDAANTFFGQMAKARPHCEAAVIGANPDPEGLFHIAVVLQREGLHDYALRLFNQAATAGVTAAHTKVGDYYNFGIGGVKEDIDRAVKEYNTAAAAGDVTAKSTLAIMHQLGRGVPQDFDMMLALLEASADEGYHFAQLRLAELYMSPKSVPPTMARELDLPDPVKASEYYELAAAQGNQKAQAELDKAADGQGLFNDPAVRLKLVMRGVERGDAKALNTLGFMHEQGDGVEFDPIRAAQLYIQALETGDLPIEQLRQQVNGRYVRWDRETAVEFQVILQNRGYYAGYLDGAIGPGTLAGVQRLINGEEPQY